MSNHTPDIWEVWEPEAFEEDMSRAAQIIIGRKSRGEMQEIAYINCQSCHFEDETPTPVPSGLLREPYWPKAPAEAIANAHLIAAAPMLLKACEKAVALYELIINDWGSRIDPDGDLPPELYMLRLAIAKAKDEAFGLELFEDEEESEDESWPA